MRDDSGTNRYVVQWFDAHDECVVTWKTADRERAERIRDLAEEDGFDAEVLAIVRYRARDIGYGVEEGEVYLPPIASPDWTGKRAYVTPDGEVVYLFDDEVDP